MPPVAYCTKCGQPVSAAAGNCPACGAQRYRGPTRAWRRLFFEAVRSFDAGRLPGFKSGTWWKMALALWAYSVLPASFVVGCVGPPEYKQAFYFWTASWTVIIAALALDLAGVRSRLSLSLPDVRWGRFVRNHLMLTIGASAILGLLFSASLYETPAGHPAGVKTEAGERLAHANSEPVGKPSFVSGVNVVLARKLDLALSQINIGWLGPECSSLGVDPDAPDDFQLDASFHVRNVGKVLRVLSLSLALVSAAGGRTPFSGAKTLLLGPGQDYDVDLTSLEDYPAVGLPSLLSRLGFSAEVILENTPAGVEPLVRANVGLPCPAPVLERSW